MWVVDTARLFIGKYNILELYIVQLPLKDAGTLKL
jgi:hypothetical protein